MLLLLLSMLADYCMSTPTGSHKNRPATADVATKHLLLNPFQCKKAVLSQTTARCALYMGALKISGLPDYAHGYFSQNYSWAFVPIDPMNVHTKFEVRSFTRS